MLIRFSFFLALLSFGLLACEGPTGPPGPPGPRREVIIIERELSTLLYDEYGNVIIEDSRITPTTFQALYFKTILPNPNPSGPDEVEYVPLDYYILSAVSITPEETKLKTPTLFVAEGMLLIVDINRNLLALASESFDDKKEVRLAIFVSQ